MTGHPDPPDEVTAMVAAVGGLLAWDGAMVGHLRPADAGVVELKRWRPSGPARGAEGPPAWVGDMTVESWAEDRVRWRPAGSAGETPQPAAVAVPIRTGDQVTGVLSFFGHQLREPGSPLVDLVEALAGLLAGRVLAPRTAVTVPAPVGPTGSTGPPGDNSLERAIALVDVFAYTVEVSEQGDFSWCYFGPNSAAVFGGPVTADESLTSLMRRHVHPDDELAVSAFERAVAMGNRLEIEVRIVGLDRTTRWVSWRSVPRRTDGTLYVDGVATDVSARHSLGQSRHDLATAHAQYTRAVDLRRRHALVVRDANDNVLQRLFAAGLRLQMLRRKLDDAEAHAASTIAFQLDQAATDLRELIIDLNTVIESDQDESTPDGGAGEPGDGAPALAAPRVVAADPGTERGLAATAG